MQIDGDLIRKLRGQQGISQECLANEIDCSRSIIAKIEKGERSGLCIVYKIAQYFNISIESLILK
jgi:transcriptional regulator with XRE-family HTH domain